MANIYDPFIEEQGTLFLTLYSRGKFVPERENISADYSEDRQEYRWSVTQLEGWFDCIILDENAIKVAAGRVYIQDDAEWYRIESDDAYLDVKFENACKGNGIYKYTVLVEDASGFLIENARVSLVKPGLDVLTQGTNESGVATFSVNDGLWEIRVYKTGFQHVPVTINIEGDGGTTTILEMVGSPPTPPENNQVRGIVYVYDENGQRAAGANVSIRLIKPTDDTGKIYSGKIVTVVSDGSGLVVLPDLFLGATYEYWLGVANNIGITQTREFLIPLDALDPIEFPSIVGKECKL